MATMLSIAIKNHGCKNTGSSRASSVFAGRDVVRSGVSCEVIYQALLISQAK
jgi:hypothetical protein